MDYKRVLVIAYIFPPLGGSGVYRTLKFVKYLPQFGWSPIVVCGDEDRFNLGYDESLVAEIPPEARVLRLPFVSPYGVRAYLHRLFGVHPTAARQSSTERNGQGQITNARRTREIARKILKRLGCVLHPLEFPPVDGAIYWALSAVRFCYNLIKTENIDLVYTSSAPYSDHVAGWLLKRLTGIPWAADFRDPWTQLWKYSNRGWRRKIDQFIEKRVLRYADRVISVTPTDTQGLWTLVPDRNPEDFVTIENGFDEEDFAFCNEHSTEQFRSNDGKIVLAHIGKVWDGLALSFLQALELLGADATSFRVLFVGGLAPTEEQWLCEHTIHCEVVTHKQRIPHLEAIRHMQASDVVVLLRDHPKLASCYSGKLFEYMRCGKPIFMIGPEGDAAKLIAESGTGCFVPSEDLDRAANTLRLLAARPDEFQARYYRPRPEVIARYERRALTQRLASLFDDLVAESRAYGKVKA